MAMQNKTWDEVAQDAEWLVCILPRSVALTTTEYSTHVHRNGCHLFWNNLEE